MKKADIQMVSFTQGGAALCHRLCRLLGDEAEGYAPRRHVEAGGLITLEGSVRSWAAERFACVRALLFIGAAGIAVRAVAPLLRSKGSDPAVLCMDEEGRFVIPILSGHIGGANALAVRLASLTGGTPVLTTATDVRGCFSPDAWAAGNGCAVPRLSQIRGVSSALLEGIPVGFHSDFPVDGPLPPGVYTDLQAEYGIQISLEDKPVFSHTLWLLPKCLWIGIGCRKGVDDLLLERMVRTVLEAHGLPLEGVAGVATISLKAREAALVAFCKKYNLPMTAYPVEELLRVEGSRASSAFVREVTGVDNVCERAALAGGGRLLVEKQADQGVTVAVAARDFRVHFEGV